MNRQLEGSDDICRVGQSFQNNHSTIPVCRSPEPEVNGTGLSAGC